MDGWNDCISRIDEAPIIHRTFDLCFTYFIFALLKESRQINDDLWPRAGANTLFNNQLLIGRPGLDGLDIRRGEPLGRAVGGAGSLTQVEAKAPRPGGRVAANVLGCVSTCSTRRSKSPPFPWSRTTDPISYHEMALETVWASTGASERMERLEARVPRRR